MSVTTLPSYTFGLVFASFMFSACARASVIQFTNGLSTNVWGQAGNWDLNRVPNSGDDVIIGGGWNVVIVTSNGASCRTLNAASALQLNGPFHVYVSATLSAGLYMYIASGMPNLYNDGTISIGSFWNWFDGSVFQKVGAEITLEKGCTLIGYKGIYSHNLLGGTMINKGQATFHSGLQMNNYDPAAGITVLVNDAAGTMAFDSGAGISDVSFCTTTCLQGGYGAIINYGSWTMVGNSFIERDVSFYNDGLYTQSGGTSYIEQFSNVSSGAGPLTTGTFVMENGGVLLTDGREITEIGADASVMLYGAGASMTGIQRTMTIRGKLVVDAGAQLSLAPYFFGTVSNHGILAIGPGSVVTVLGNVIQYADGTLDIIIADATPSGRGWLQTYQSSGFAGKLQVDFYDTSLVHPGAEFPVAGLVPDGCCGIDGKFDQVVVYPPTRLPVSAEFEPTLAKLVIGGAVGVRGRLLPQPRVGDGGRVPARVHFTYGPFHLWRKSSHRLAGLPDPIEVAGPGDFRACLARRRL